MKVFITGTDTEVGKTYVSAQLLQFLQQQGFSTLGLKPVASGAPLHGHQSDSYQLQQNASVKLPLTSITPYSFLEPIAPHIAAELSNQPLTVQSINDQMLSTLATPADIILIEGFGGWYAPLNHLETMADFVKYHRFPVIMVVGIYLGCLNHATLTTQAIQNDGMNILGWIANCLDPTMLYQNENIEYLKNCLPAPYLGKVNYKGFFEIEVSPEENTLVWPFSSCNNK